MDALDKPQKVSIVESIIEDWRLKRRQIIDLNDADKQFNRGYNNCLDELLRYLRGIK